MPRVVLAVFASWLVAMLAGGVQAGPIEDGVAAFKRGDYATALRHFRPLADQGVGNAQFNLALMYDNGLGVPRDDAEAVKWYRKAADQGLAHAQLAPPPPAALASPSVPARQPGGTAPGTKFRDCSECPEMIWIPPGSFTMGSPPDKPNESPQRTARIGVPLAVGVFEVKFAEWDVCVAGGGCNGYRPDDRGWGRGNRPVINVSWTGAKAYVAWLSQKTGHRYRLLSESEWEYAARAGTTTQFSCGDGDACLASVAWHDANASGQTRPVGGKGANAFGLHDMHGNVSEWVEDCWNDSYAGAPSDGGAWTAGNCGVRVVRGGAFNGNPQFLRAAKRFRVGTEDRGGNLGFRVVR